MNNFSGNLYDLLLLSGLVIMASTIFAGLLFWLLKIKAPNWVFLILAILPLVFMLLWTPNNRIIGAHGLWHISIVYQIMNGNIPPGHPYLAGEPLLYPWGTHLLVAAMSYGFRISPPTAFALLSLCSLLLTIILVFKISKFFSKERIANVFAVFLAIFGITVLPETPILELFNRITKFNIQFRAIPIFNKFSGPDTTHLGVMFFALSLYSILHIFSKQNKINLYYATLVISVLGAGFFYPFDWLGVIAFCFFSCLILYFLHRQVVLRKIIIVSACVVGATLILLPYLHLISAGKNEAVSLMLNSPRQVLKDSLKYLFIVLPVSIIIFCKRKILLDLLRANADSTFLLITAITTTALMFVFIFAPTVAGYKFAMLSYLSLGILCSVFFSNLYRSNQVICFILTVSFLLPFSSFMMAKIAAKNSDYAYIKEKQIYLYHSDPGESDIYNWITNETNNNAIFLDSRSPVISIFGRRQVYAGLEEDYLWYAGKKWMIGVLGYSPDMIEKRERVIHAIYSDADVEIGEDVILELKSIKSAGEVYIVARETVVNNKLVEDEHFNKVFESEGTGIYKLSN